MAGVLAVAAIVALPQPSRAADRGVRPAVAHDHGRHDWRSVGPAFRHGFDRGWRDGTEEGLRDGRRRRDPRYWRERDYRNADAGYKRWMGRRSRYEAGYREGYAAAYQRAYKTARPGRPHPARRRDR